MSSRTDEVPGGSRHPTVEFGGEGIPLDPLSEVKVAVAADGPNWAEAQVARNAPCPCGSGKKFKKCCGPRSRR